MDYDTDTEDIRGMEECFIGNTAENIFNVTKQYMSTLDVSQNSPSKDHDLCKAEKVNTKFIQLRDLSNNNKFQNMFLDLAHMTMSRLKMSFQYIRISHFIRHTTYDLSTVYTSDSAHIFLGDAGLSVLMTYGSDPDNYIYRIKSLKNSIMSVKANCKEYRRGIKIATKQNGIYETGQTDWSGSYGSTIVISMW